MNPKLSSLLDKKKKKIPGILTQNPTALPIRKTNHVPKNEGEKAERVDPLAKLPKPVNKPKLDVITKIAKIEKSAKLPINNQHLNKLSVHDFDHLRPVTAATNGLLKQNTKENERILGEIEANFSSNEEFEGGRNRKRWSDLPTYPQDISLLGLNKANYAKKTSELPNPNLEDNNLINQTNKGEKQKLHVRNGSILQRAQTKDQNSINANMSEPKLQDITNRKIIPKPKPQLRYDSTQSSYYGNSAYPGQLEDSATLKPRNLPRRNNNIIGEQNIKLKNKLGDRQKEELENVNPIGLKTRTVSANEDYTDILAPTQRNFELEKYKNDFDETIVDSGTNLKLTINEVRTLNTNTISGHPLSALIKNPKSDTGSSGHTPTYATTNANQRLNSSNLSSKSTNTQASSINKSSLTNENAEKKSTGKACSNSGKGGQIKSKANLMRFGNNFQKYSDHKTDSTYISGGDSTSPALDCEETLGSNIINLLNNKNDNFSWLDRDEFKMRTLDLFTMEKELIPSVISEKTSLGRGSMTTEEELASFNPESNACAIDPETIDYLIMREIEYAPDPHYFENKQSNITWIMRAILLDWMMEVCMEFTLKRETFHYAVNYVDRYLSTVSTIQKWELQLIGVSAMYLAAKVEEIYSPKVADFARSADNGYTCQQIVDMELKMMKSLKWFLNPPSLNTWANWYMCQWDLYIEHSELAKNHALILSCKDGLIQFKQPNEKSYARFREIMQLIDCAVLDVQTLQYKPRALIASFMYMTLGKYFKQFSEQQIYDEFPKSSLYLIDQQYAFNDLFGDFLLYSFGFQLVDLLPSIQYASTFFRLPLNFDLPTAAKINKENVLEGHFEEFLAYQTHHPLNIDYIRRRPRNNF